VPTAIQVQALTLAAVAPWLYDRYVAFSPMAASRPGSLQNLQTFASHEVKYQDRVRNCEDVIMEESLGVAFLSCDPGRDRWNTVMVSSNHDTAHRASTHGFRVRSSRRILLSIMLASTSMITQLRDWTTQHVSNSSQSTNQIFILSALLSTHRHRHCTL
jgi:hypothetical protein